MNTMLFDLVVLLALGFVITAVNLTAARMHEPAFKTPPPMTLQETQTFFSTFKLEE